MPAPKNTFKAALAQNKPQIGCWLTFAEAYAAELMSTTGFDWLVIDGEHGPNDLRSIRDQLMVIDPSPSHAVVRVPYGQDWIVKQALDAGAQTLLVPLIDTAEQARDMVRACRYAPNGIRGMGGAGSRVTRFGSIPDYVTTADAEICLLVQAESRQALENLDEILAVEGVDGVFIGPADLSADMGYPGDSGAPEVQAVIEAAIRKIRKAGKAAGILTLTLEGAKTHLDQGATFVAVGIETLVLAKAARALSADAKGFLDKE
ncbi:4-hydroxy-2-oxo-heptane-1,7-dioate aldolase [Shimia sp. SK013]|uniref:HpcH/HpaI aldolase family protein n=1 Tax=Shimia sp. SK013 TaxID=1389006 RepID=UPI0006B4E68C|nr:HpcH/HpaI aldolase/citrate lyase family protein [Shimia sp. SK013]KPA23562.1 4-hydroxy-2-oxo-heptane-1,7-dioate aldolase [Shimia sp. SK013]